MGLLLLQVAKEHGRQLESAQEELAIIRAEKAELAVRTETTRSRFCPNVFWRS